MESVGKKPQDSETRERLRAWLLHYRDTRYEGSNAALARALGVSSPTVTQILNRDRTMGLDLVVRIHRFFHVETDRLLDADPPRSADRPTEAASGDAGPARQEQQPAVRTR